MNAFGRKRKMWLPLALLLAGLLLAFAVNAGRWLILDQPEHSDVIVVLAGETDRRPARALELLRQGLAPRIVMDVPADSNLYGVSELELAQRWVEKLPEAASITICTIAGLSTRDESHDVAQCLAQEKSDHILIVTSDYHTRRARSIFEHELHGKVFSMAAARDDGQFGARWWKHRQWAKTLVDEWMRVIWWNAVDRWR